VKVDEEIVELTKQLELVEKDHHIQLEANNTQLERLNQTKEQYETRKEQFDKLIRPVFKIVL